MIRRNLVCQCGNRDDEDVPSLDTALPLCSAECGRTMHVESIENADGWVCAQCGTKFEHTGTLYQYEGQMVHDKSGDTCGPVLPI